MSSSKRAALLLAAAAVVLSGCTTGGTSSAGSAVSAEPAGGGAPARPAAFSPLGGDPRVSLKVLGGRIRPGVTTVEQQRHDDVLITVTLSPARPGWNLVRVDQTPADAGTGGHEPGHAGGHSATHSHEEHGPAADHEGGEHAAEQPVRVGTDPDRLQPATSRPGVDGSWARVRLASGPSTLYVAHGPDHRIPFLVDTGTGPKAIATATGPDGPECAAAAVGGLLAGATPTGTCPADGLDARSAAGLRGALSTLADRGASTIALVADSSERGWAAERLVHAEAAHHRLRVVGPGQGSHASALLVVSGWKQATTALVTAAHAQQRRVTYEHGVWLAPWLFTPRIVDSVPGAVLPLGFDVRGDEALAYEAALRRALPGMAPTAAGFAGWSRGRRDTQGDVALYAASRAAYMPAAPGHDHHTTTVAWFPGGTVTRVSGPLG